MRWLMPVILMPSLAVLQWVCRVAPVGRWRSAGACDLCSVPVRSVQPLVVCRVLCYEHTAGVRKTHTPGVQWPLACQHVMLIDHKMPFFDHQLQAVGRTLPSGHVVAVVEASHGYRQESCGQRGSRVVPPKDRASVAPTQGCLLGMRYFFLPSVVGGLNRRRLMANRHRLADDRIACWRPAVATGFLFWHYGQP